MKKIILNLIVFSFLSLPWLILAAPVVSDITEAPNVDVYQMSDKIVNVIFTILLLAAAVMIAVAAFSFLGSSGDPGKVDVARNMIIYALIAIIVAALAKGLVLFVKNYLLVPAT